MSVQRLLELLEQYKPSAQEQESLAKTIKFVQQHEHCFDRNNLHGHITGSAWLVNRNNTKALLAHHKKLNLWLQPGGHAEGETDVLQVSLREAQEESGIAEIIPLAKNIFDLDVHTFPAKGNMPAHFHFDIRFLLQAQHEQHVASDESHAVRWFTYSELVTAANENALDGSVWRMAEKWRQQKKHEI